MRRPDTVLDTFRAALRERLARSLVPAHLHEGLLRYVVDRIVPGSFLRAVLENNLLHACAYADPVSRAALTELVLFLVDETPATCWGSPAHVAAWLTRDGPVVDSS